MMVIDVDKHGCDADGNDYTFLASPEAVREGLIVAKPVTLRYPGGRLRPGTQILITELGMQRARAGMAS